MPNPYISNITNPLANPNDVIDNLTGVQPFWMNPVQSPQPIQPRVENSMNTPQYMLPNAVASQLGMNIDANGNLGFIENKADSQAGLDSNYTNIDTQTPIANKQYGAFGRLGGDISDNPDAINLNNKLTSNNARLGYATASMVGDTVNELIQNSIKSNASNNAVVGESLGGNSWLDVFNNGTKVGNAVQSIRDNAIDYSNVRNNANMYNVLNDNLLQPEYIKGETGLQTAGSIGSTMLADAAKGASIGSMIPGIGTATGAIIGGVSGLARGAISAIQHKNNLNDARIASQNAYANSVQSAYDTISNNNARQQRREMRNYFQQGGYLQPDNGVTMFDTGGSHQQNPYGGIQQGIAPDGQPNLVEEGEVKYKDYIYTKRHKPSKSLLKKYNLPEKYDGNTFAEIAMQIQKPSEDRPNDPIALRTLDEMMSRLRNAQEEYNQKREERQLAKAFDALPLEEKAGLAQLAMQGNQQVDMSMPEDNYTMPDMQQPQSPQELGMENMMAKGGRLYQDGNKLIYDWTLNSGEPKQIPFDRKRSPVSNVLFDYYINNNALQGGRLTGDETFIEHHSQDFKNPQSKSSTYNISSYTTQHPDGSYTYDEGEYRTNSNDRLSHGYTKHKTNDFILRTIDMLNRESDPTADLLSNQLTTYASGGGIHIDPSKKGTFTAAATKHGMGVQAFANQVLAHKENYSPAMVKKAVFAKNFGGHKHANGDDIWTNSNYNTPYPLRTNPYFPVNITTPISTNQEPLNVQNEVTNLVSNFTHAREKNRSLGYNDEFQYFNNGQYDEGYLNWLNNVALQSEDDEAFKHLSNIYNDVFGKSLTLDKARALGQDKKFGDFHRVYGDLYSQYLNSQNQPAPAQPTASTPLTADNNVSSTPASNDITRRDIIEDKVDLTPLEDNWMRKMPIVGSFANVMAAAGPADMTYANALSNIGSKYNPIAPQLLGGYRRYNPYDINLANNQAMAQQASLQNYNRSNSNRASQTANALALQNQYEQSQAARNLAWQQANEQNRAAVDQYNLGIDQINAGTIQQYDAINQDILDKRNRMQAAAAQAADNATTLRSQNMSNAMTNLANNLGAYGKETFGMQMINRAIQDKVFKNPWLYSNGLLTTKKETV